MNNKSFVYGAATGSPASNSLSETGLNIWMILGLAGAMILVGTKIFHSRFRKHSIRFN